MEPTPPPPPPPPDPIAEIQQGIQESKAFFDE
jgi:hypothetical protein